MIPEFHASIYFLFMKKKKKNDDCTYNDDERYEDGYCKDDYNIREPIDV